MVHLQHLLKMTDGLHAHAPQVAGLTTEFILGTAHADLLAPVLHRILGIQGRYLIAQKTGPADPDYRNRDLQVTAHCPELLVLSGEIDLLLAEFTEQFLCWDMPRLTSAGLTIPEFLRTAPLASL